MNEEFDGRTYGGPVNRTYYSNINAYNQIFVDTVRLTGGNNASRWLLVPGWNTNIELTTGDYGFTLPTDRLRSAAIPDGEKRIIISVHYYDPWDFCGDPSSPVAEWGASESTASDSKLKPNQTGFIDSQFQLVHKTFVEQGYPFIVGEYGAIDKTYRNPRNRNARVAFTTAICVSARKYGGVPVVWDDGTTGNNSFGLFDRSNFVPLQPAILTAIKSIFSDARVGRGAAKGEPTSAVPNAPDVAARSQNMK